MPNTETKSHEEKANPPQTNGLTEEQQRCLLAAAGRYKNNPEFMERGRGAIAEYRRQIQEEAECGLDGSLASCYHLVNA